MQAAARLVRPARCSCVTMQESMDGLGHEAVARRDFLYVATGAFIGLGAVMAAWPFIDQMNPGANVLSAGAPLSVNLSSLQPGQQVVVRWRSRPIFVVRRTKANLEALKSPSLTDKLRDPDSQEPQQPVYAKNAYRSVNPDYLVVVGICTHLGCIPLFNQGEFGGYLCPCHGSQYDTAGRIRKGPAPQNLHLPPYQFVSDSKIRIGEESGKTA